MEENKVVYEVGIDEVGKGAVYGRVYSAAVILLPDYLHSGAHWTRQIKDSKKFASKKKLYALTAEIEADAHVLYAVHYEEASTIDSEGIQTALFKTIYRGIFELLEKLPQPRSPSMVHIRMDGNVFYNVPEDNPLYKAYPWINEVVSTEIKGDARFPSISTASMIAKTARDQYILSRTSEIENQKYKLHSNKGYGTAYHLRGIQEHGLTPDHRSSFLLKHHY